MENLSAIAMVSLYAKFEMSSLLVPKIGVFQNLYGQLTDYASNLWFNLFDRVNLFSLLVFVTCTTVKCIAGYFTCSRDRKMDHSR